jgi:hypothetical protein
MTEAVRRAMQRSEECVGALDRRHRISPNPVQKLASLSDGAKGRQNPVMCPQGY